MIWPVEQRKKGMIQPADRTEQTTALDAEYKYPPMPSTLSEVLELISLPKSEQEPGRLLDIVQRDPMTAAYVLRRVNSAYYGLSRQISHVDRAVVLLGFSNVSNLVLSIGLRQTFHRFKEREEELILEHIMKTSVAAAAFAKDLAEYLALPLSETAFSAGLLHQIGRMILLYTAPDAYAPLWCERSLFDDSVQITTPTIEQERSYFKTDYVKVGATTASKWNLPDKLSIIIRSHRQPGSVSDAHLRALTLAVGIGGVFGCQLFEESCDGASRARPMLTALARMRNVDAEDLKTLLDQKGDVVQQFAATAMDS